MQGYEIRVLLCAVVAFVVCFAVTPIVKRLAYAIGAIDVPADNRRMHKVPTARLGGLAIYIAFIAAVLIFSPTIDTKIKGMLIGSVIIVVIGVVDDVQRIPWWIKLIAQIGAATIVVLHGVRIEAFTNPISYTQSGWLDVSVISIPITIIWIVAITNAVNFIDGLDGLAVGVSAISSVTLLVIAWSLQLPSTAIIIAALAGGCFGFLPYNTNPAKLFMGDTGATFIGFILAAVSVQGLFKHYVIISFLVPFLVLGLPIFDIVVSVFRRLISGKNPAHADRSHIHHRLIDMGLTQKQVVAVLYTVSGILGLTAVLLSTDGTIRLIVMIFGFIVAVALSYKVLYPKKPVVKVPFEPEPDVKLYDPETGIKADNVTENKSDNVTENINDTGDKKND